MRGGGSKKYKGAPCLGRPYTNIRWTVPCWGLYWGFIPVVNSTLDWSKSRASLDESQILNSLSSHRFMIQNMRIPKYLLKGSNYSGPSCGYLGSTQGGWWCLGKPQTLKLWGSGFRHELLTPILGTICVHARRQNPSQVLVSFICSQCLGCGFRVWGCSLREALPASLVKHSFPKLL